MTKSKGFISNIKCNHPVCVKWLHVGDNTLIGWAWLVAALRLHVVFECLTSNILWQSGDAEKKTKKTYKQTQIKYKMDANTDQHVIHWLFSDANEILLPFFRSGARLGWSYRL